VHGGQFTLVLDSDPVVAAGDKLLVAENDPERRR